MAELKDVNHIHPLPDFVQGGKDFLPSDFLDEKKNFINLMDVFLERLETVDVAMVKMAEDRRVISASGANLDEIGRQLGFERNGLEDNDFRAVLMILSASSRTSGTRSELIASLKQLFGEGNFSTWKGWNYRFDINITNSCFDVKNVIQEIVDMLPMPTHLRVVESSGIAFGFEEDGNNVSGFGSDEDVDGFGGGIASEIYVSEDEGIY
ncbi:hypothetical protein CHUUTOTORO_00010 [Serratia phage vB_SmaM-ChuuTotoro]|nr:hypothetical protein CHUUTOTORO_00010 [Serratia phage vB_SmaM-ChuuTotoro]